jgi:hypothetical protein
MEPLLYNGYIILCKFRVPYHEISKGTKCFRFTIKLLQDIVTGEVFGDGGAIHHAGT